MSNSPTPAAPDEPPTPSTASRPSVGHYVDNAIAEGRRVAASATDRARSAAKKASPQIQTAMASANDLLTKASATRPWVKPAVIGVVAFVVALILWTAASAVFRSGARSSGAGQNLSQQSSPSTNPRQAFVDEANKMGQVDSVLAARAIEMVERQNLNKTIGWQPIDSMMEQASPETQSAYRDWRQSVISP